MYVCKLYLETLAKVIVLKEHEHDKIYTSCMSTIHKLYRELKQIEGIGLLNVLKRISVVYSMKKLKLEFDEKYELLLSDIKYQF